MVINQRNNLCGNGLTHEDHKYTIKGRSNPFLKELKALEVAFCSATCADWTCTRLFVKFRNMDKGEEKLMKFLFYVNKIDDSWDQLPPKHLDDVGLKNYSSFNSVDNEKIPKTYVQHPETISTE